MESSPTCSREPMLTVAAHLTWKNSSSSGEECVMASADSRLTAAMTTGRKTSERRWWRTSRPVLHSMALKSSAASRTTKPPFPPSRTGTTRRRWTSLGISTMMSLHHRNGLATDAIPCIWIPRTVSLTSRSTQESTVSSKSLWWPKSSPYIHSARSLRQAEQVVREITLTRTRTGSRQALSSARRCLVFGATLTPRRATWTVSASSRRTPIASPSSSLPSAKPTPGPHPSQALSLSAQWDHLNSKTRSSSSRILQRKLKKAKSQTTSTMTWQRLPSSWSPSSSMLPSWPWLACSSTCAARRGSLAVTWPANSIESECQVVDVLSYSTKLKLLAK